MKKTKLLAPLLTIAGLGASITPAVMLTSCSCGNPDTGKEVEKSEFINKLNTVQSNFEANHNSFIASEVKYTKYTNEEGETKTYDCTAVNETEEVESDASNRLVTLIIEDQSTPFTISAKATVTEMKNIIDNAESKYSNFKYLEFDNYYQLQYQYDFDAGNTNYTMTTIREIYKNGFFKRWKAETRVKETGKIKQYEGEWVDYSTSPHAITNFDFDPSIQSYQAYLEKDVTYTAKFSSSTSEINLFGAYYLNGEQTPVFYAIKDIEFTVDGNNDTSNWAEEESGSTPHAWKRSSKLAVGQKVIAKFKLNEEENHYALVGYTSI